MISFRWQRYLAWSKRSSARRGRQPRVLLHIEPLESRTLLSTCTVDRLSDTGDGSGQVGDLRYCLTQATAARNKIVITATGTIDLTGPLPDLAGHLKLVGPGADALTVRRDTGGDYRIFTIDSGADVKISGMTITGGLITGTSPQGGGILVDDATLTLAFVTLSGNRAMVSSMESGVGNGGGIYVSGGTPKLSFSIVSGNEADGTVAGVGGGIYGSGVITVDNSTISGNSARGGKGGDGGGIYVAGGTVTINRSTLSDNSAPICGGGIWGGATINRSTLSGNSAGVCGGAIYGGATVLNSTISGNNAGGPGGGIEGGGVLYNSTIAGNFAYQGGGIDGGATARDTIIADNADFQGSPDLSGNLNSLGHNLIGNSQGGSGFDPTDLLDINPMLDRLQDNGGPTQTMALLPGSPAIDIGDNTGAPMWDQRGPGFARIVNGTIDIGAFEVQENGGSSRPGPSVPGDAALRQALRLETELGPAWQAGETRRDSLGNLSLKAAVRW